MQLRVKSKLASAILYYSMVATFETVGKPLNDTIQMILSSLRIFSCIALALFFNVLQNASNTSCLFVCSVSLGVTDLQSKIAALVASNTIDHVSS